jgi:hypothetical protein
MTSLSGLLPTVENLPQLLTDLGNSPSRVAVWRLMCYIVAVSMNTLETLWDSFLNVVNTTIANKIPGTLLWYQQQAFIFQYGDPLTLINNKWQYATVTPANRIVNRCAAIERGATGILIKAAIFDGTSIAPLSAPQLVAFNAYYQKIKYAGPAITCVSYTADLLRLSYTIYYDPLVDLAVLQPAVEAAINNFIGNLTFNGVYNLTAQTDAIQRVPGVVDPRLTDAQATYGLLPYAPIIGQYASNAGYLSIDPAYPLSTTITYVPYV